jgi:hypothetical protein
MNSNYAILTGNAGDMLRLGSDKTDKDTEIFVAKILALQGAIELYERDIIGNTEKTTELNALYWNWHQVVVLEGENYGLPDPRTYLYDFMWRLKSETKETLDTIWGQYAPLFEGQTEDLAQYAALLGDARALGKTTILPR